MMLYLAVLAGAFLYLLFSLNEAYPKPEFLWRIFFKQNWLPSLTNVICGLLLVWGRESISLELTTLWGVFLGFSGQVILKKFFKMFDTKVNTVVGLN
jgi:hypothetical protein